MRRLTFNVLEGKFDLIDIEDINLLQKKILGSILIELDYTIDAFSPKSVVLTDEKNVIWDEII